MKIIINGALNRLSYGNVAVCLVDALIRLGHEVQFFPINDYGQECEQIYSENIGTALTNSLRYNANVPSIRIYHQFSLAQRIGGSPEIGFPIFELDTFTNLEKLHLASMDYLFVCSKWAEKVIESNGFIGLPEIVPLGVDERIFYPTNNSPKNKTVFLSIGKFEYRKGHPELIESFNKAFTSTDNVELWMVCDNIFQKEEEKRTWYAMCKTGPIADKVRLIPRMNNQADLRYLMNQANFMVSPSRAEGWNLPILEGMACGIPPIVTNYSGHTEFCDGNNSLLIDFTEMEPADDGVWFKPGGITNQGNWGKFDDGVKQQLVNQLRRARELHITKSPILQDIKEECLKTAKKFTWTNAAETIISHLH